MTGAYVLRRTFDTKREAALSYIGPDGRVRSAGRYMISMITHQHGDGSEHVHLFCKMNAFKYIWRSSEHDDGEQVNLTKAIWYLRKAT